MKIMKKAIIIALVLAMAVLAGCAAEKEPAVTPGTAARTVEPASSDARTEPASGETPDVTGEYKTLADVFAFEDCGQAFDDENFVYVFEADGVYMRAVANIPEEISEQITDLEFDEHYFENVQKLIENLPIAKLENLSEMEPTEEEVNALIGKTGQELLDMGFVCTAYSTTDMEFTMENDCFAYSIVFDGTIEDSDDPDVDEAIKPLTVKTAVLVGLGDATGMQ